MASRLGTPLNTGIFGGGTVSSISANFTTPGTTISNPCIAILVLFGDTSAAISSVTVTPSGGGAANAVHVVTAGTLGTNPHASSLYRLTGALAINTQYTVDITLGSAAEVWGFAEVLQQVDQTTPNDDSDGVWDNELIADSIALTLTSATDNFVLCGLAANGTTLLTENGDQTDIATQTSSDTKHVGAVAGAASITVSYQGGGSAGLSAGLVAASFKNATAGQAFTLTAEHGTYGLSGQEASLSSGDRLSAETGTYSLLGADALRDIEIDAEQGSYALNGQVATLRSAFALGCAVGAYLLNGQSAQFAYSGAIISAAEEVTRHFRRVAANRGFPFFGRY